MSLETGMPGMPEQLNTEKELEDDPGSGKSSQEAGGFSYIFFDFVLFQI